MEAKLVELSGQVERDTVAPGSKSERSAVVLRADDGETYILRRQDGPAFADPELDGLVGSRLTIDGVANGSTLIMRQWRAKD